MKILLIILMINNLFSQNESEVDSLLLDNQQQMLKNQEKIIGEVEYIDPLIGKTYGIEFNPTYFLLSSANDEGFVITGSLSLFSISKHAEIAFPIYYKVGDDDLQILHLDSHYRRFIGKHRNGLYISSGLRYTQLKGKEGSSFLNFDWDVSDGTISQSKLGITFGIGYRIFGKSGWYWGASLFGGRYLTSQENSVVGAGSADSKAIIDMEFLKIGKTF